MPRPVTVLAAVALGVSLLVVALSWATRTRTDYTGTPTPPPFSKVSPLVVRPGQQACQSEVALERTTRGVVVQSWNAPAPGPPLEVSASAPGYRASATLAGGYSGRHVLQALVASPPRSLLATVCVRNAGHVAVPLEASTEQRVAPRPVTVADGRPAHRKLTLLLTEGRLRSLADRPGEILDRIAAFKPWWVGRVSLAVLALLVLVGVPALVIRALWTADD